MQPINSFTYTSYMQTMSQGLLNLIHINGQEFFIEFFWIFSIKTTQHISFTIILQVCESYLAKRQKP